MAQEINKISSELPALHASFVNAVAPVISMDQGQVTDEERRILDELSEMIVENIFKEC